MFTHICRVHVNGKKITEKLYSYESNRNRQNMKGKKVICFISVVE